MSILDPEAMKAEIDQTGCSVEAAAEKVLRKGLEDAWQDWRITGSRETLSQIIWTLISHARP